MSKRHAPVAVTPEPYNGPMVVALLRRMPTSALRDTKTSDFQRWPARHILPAATLRELISNEQASRR